MKLTPSSTTSIVAVWVILFILLLIPLALITALLVRLAKPRNCVSTGIYLTGFTGSIAGLQPNQQILSCHFPTPCATGPVGLGGLTGPTGFNGPIGYTGIMGISILPNAYGILTDQLIQNIQNTVTNYPQYYQYAVTQDLRNSFNSPTTLIGDKTGHLLLWLPDLRTWIDQGPLCGEVGATGIGNFVTGGPGPTGATGNTGFGGLRGPIGPTGPSSIPGPSQVALTSGSRFGPGIDGDTNISNSNITLSRDMFYKNLTMINSTINTNGYAIFANESAVMVDSQLLNEGQNGDDAVSGLFAAGGVGGAAGRFFGGGVGAKVPIDGSVGIGGPTPYALSPGSPFGLTGGGYTGPNNFAGGRDYSVGLATSGYPGLVFSNTQEQNLIALHAATNPIFYFGGDTGFRMVPLSGGSGGAAPANTGSPGGGGGGGVICLCTPLLDGSNSRISVNGGLPGTPLGGGLLAGRGGGGLIIVSSVTHAGSILYDFQGGTNGRVIFM